VTPTKVLIGQILIIFGIVVVGTWYATQWTAAALGYQMRLGAPWFLFHHLPVYHPWQLFEWWYFYESYAPSIFNTAGTIAAASGLLAAAAAIVGSVWRARQSTLVVEHRAPDLVRSAVFITTGDMNFRIQQTYGHTWSKGGCHERVASGRSVLPLIS
jgi:type IV secretory pathway TraG/TraD family ATPase VirD4